MTTPSALAKECPLGHPMKNVNSLYNPEAGEHWCPVCNYSEKMSPETVDFLNKTEKAHTAQAQMQQRPPAPGQRS